MVEERSPPPAQGSETTEWAPSRSAGPPPASGPRSLGPFPQPQRGEPHKAQGACRPG